MSTRIISVRIDTDKINESIARINQLPGYVSHSVGSSHLTHFRDLLSGWHNLGVITDWSEIIKSDIIKLPGVYTLVYNGEDITQPLLSDRIITTGETFVSFRKRLYTHVGALTGKITNMTEKWNKYRPDVNAHFNCEIALSDISIIVRPHNQFENDLVYDTIDSRLLEKQALAVYIANGNPGTPANTRDLPEPELIKVAEEYLSNFKINQ